VATITHRPATAVRFIGMSLAVGKIGRPLDRAGRPI
jgi:hypothetical protein